MPVVRVLKPWLISVNGYVTDEVAKGAELVISESLAADGDEKDGTGHCRVLSRTPAEEEAQRIAKVEADAQDDLDKEAAKAEAEADKVQAEADEKAVKISLKAGTKAARDAAKNAAEKAADPVDDNKAIDPVVENK